MNNYRIVAREGYNGCIPITVYYVQVKKIGFWEGKWENVKGFEDYRRAKALLNMLSGNHE